MDLFDVVRACFRRWYVVLPLLLITTWFAYDAYTSVKPVYYSQAVVGLAPPSSRLDQTAVGVPVPRNGLLDVGGAALIANMGAMGLNEPSAVQRVVEAGGQPNYISKMFPVPATSPPLPLIMIEATQDTPDDALKTVTAVVAEAEPTVANLQQQAGVPDSQLVHTFVVSPPSTPTAGTPSRTRSTLTLFIAGTGLAILLATVIDVFFMRRRSRLHTRHGTGGTEQDADGLTAANDRQPNQEGELSPAGSSATGSG